MKRWWFKQKMKHDLKLEYYWSSDKSRMKKDLSYWMNRYDNGFRNYKPTYKNYTLTHRILLWVTPFAVLSFIVILSYILS